MMEKSANLLAVRAACWFMLCLIMVGGSVTGCSYLPFIHTDKTENKVVRSLWSSGEQFVQIERQDRQSGIPVRPNQHISDISLDRLHTALASIAILPTGQGKTIPMFNEEELKILGEYIPVGLALSGPDDDVTFAIIGHYNEALGFLKKREVTTGRVFYQDEQINIIFGDIHRELKETMGVPEDRRLNPFQPGSRARIVGIQEGILVPKEGGEIFAGIRNDWIAFPLKAPEGSVASTAQQESPVAAPAPQETGETVPATNQNTGTLSPGAPEIAPSAQTNTAAPARGVQPVTPAASKRAGAPGAGAQAVAPIAPHERAAPSAKKSTEERLLILNDLRSKKLISEEEYWRKRGDILNDL